MTGGIKTTTEIITTTTESPTDKPEDVVITTVSTVESTVVANDGTVTLPTLESWEVVDGWFAEYPPSIGQNR